MEWSKRNEARIKQNKEHKIGMGTKYEVNVSEKGTRITLPSFVSFIFSLSFHFTFYPTNPLPSPTNQGTFYLHLLPTNHLLSFFLGYLSFIVHLHFHLLIKVPSPTNPP